MKRTNTVLNLGKSVYCELSKAVLCVILVNKLKLLLFQNAAVLKINRMELT